MKWIGSMKNAIRDIGPEVCSLDFPSFRMRFNVIHFRLFKEKFCECNLLCEENLKIQHLDSYGLGWHSASGGEQWGGKSAGL